MPPAESQLTCQADDVQVLVLHKHVAHGDRGRRLVEEVVSEEHAQNHEVQQVVARVVEHNRQPQVGLHPPPHQHHDERQVHQPVRVEEHQDECHEAETRLARLIAAARVHELLVVVVLVDSLPHAAHAAYVRKPLAVDVHASDVRPMPCVHTRILIKRIWPYLGASRSRPARSSWRRRRTWTRAPCPLRSWPAGSSRGTPSSCRARASRSA